MPSFDELEIYTDGGARGNPGPAAVGVVIKEGSQVVHEFGQMIGRATNNEAEYCGVMLALKYLIDKKIQVKKIKLFLDSKLVVNQLSGFFKIKKNHLRELLVKIQILEQKIGVQVQYLFIPRAENTRADYWVNRALDSELLDSR